MKLNTFSSINTYSLSCAFFLECIFVGEPAFFQISLVFLHFGANKDTAMHRNILPRYFGEGSSRRNFTMASKSMVSDYSFLLRLGSADAVS